MVESLEDHLEGWAQGDALRADVAAAVQAVAGAAALLADLVAQGPLEGSPAAVVGDNADGDAQKELDVRADDLFQGALRATPSVAVYASEENAAPIRLRHGPTARVAVAVDPLDGSSNIDTNLSIGTIFSVLPALPAAEDPANDILRPGVDQLASGFVVYGPQTVLVLTLRRGSHAFTLDRRRGAFVLTGPDIRIPHGKREYAINASNYRHWDGPVRAYIDDCVAGADGPRGENFNMRWNASLVAEAFRILVRGGIFLYPGDSRPGYHNGRLRLVYEGNPLALVVEEAGGAAIDGESRILELRPASLHQRTPLVFGCREKVERVADYYAGRLPAPGDRSPLFGRRGLFRA